jgi:ammonium transporter
MVDTLWLLVTASLVFMMQPGFMCLEAGFTRAKNSTNVAIKNLVDFGISVLLFWAVGYGLMFGQTHLGWWGQSEFWVSLETDPQKASFFVFQMMFCSAATTIISGAVAERLKFRSYLIIACLTSGLIYPLFGHWAWHGAEVGLHTGWLGQLGFVDFSGSTVVHSIGGWVSLAALLVIGPRQGRFGKDGTVYPIPASNLPLSVLGTFLLWIGWIGFNGGNTLMFNDRVVSIISHTILSGAAGMITALILSWVLYKSPQVALMINGSLGGLVAITASCHAVSTPSSIIIGTIAGAVVLGVERLLEKWQIDDAVGAVAVHGGAGIWGTLAVAGFGQSELLQTDLDRLQQLGVQGLGISIAALWGFGLSYLILINVNRWLPLRVSAQTEQIGLNASEHNLAEEVNELFRVMEQQTQSQDLSLRVPVEPFTDVGRIAERYNQVMDALETAVTQTEAIVRTAQDAILTFQDPRGLILTANPSAAQMFGYSLDQLTQMTLPELVDLTWIDADRTDGDRTSETSDFSMPQQFQEVVGHRQDGNAVPLEVSLSRADLHDRSFFTGTFRDISDRKQAEQQQQELLKQLQHTSLELQHKNQTLEETLKQLQIAQAQLVQNEKMASLEKMVGGIAHEFNNPVSFILGNLGYLQEYVRDLLHLLQLYQSRCPQADTDLQLALDAVDLDFVQADLPKILHSIEQGATRIRDIVKSLRIFSRLDEADLKQVDVHDNLDSVLLVLQSQLWGKGDQPAIKVVRHYGQLPLVECYPKELNQACLNILLNAIEALQHQARNPVTTSDHWTPCLWITTECSTEQLVEMRIRNNGPVVPAAVCEKIFDPFFTTKPVGQGKGLGLSVSYQIVVDMHQGNLSCLSNEDQGTTFIIEIPISQQQARRPQTVV